MAKTCSVPNCRGTTLSRELCKLHYARLKKYGYVGDTKIISYSCKACGNNFSYEAPIDRKTKKQFCSVKCQNLHSKSKRPQCKVNNCDKKSINLKDGLCAMHKRRVEAHGDPHIVKKISKYPEGTVCLVEGCPTTKIVAKQMCNRHYLMWRVHGDPKGGKFEYKIRKAVTHDDGTRTCSECELRLPMTEFHKDKNATDGYRSKCKSCRIDHVKKWYSNNRERQALREAARRKSDPEKYAEKEAARYEKDKEKRLLLATEHSHLRKARKKRVKTERGITKKSLRMKFGTKCYYCGIEMDFSIGRGRRFNKSMATIEHLVPLAKGGEHTFENTVLACRHCNISKNAKTESEFQEFRNDA